MPVNTMMPNAKFEFFGRKAKRDFDLCPHCGKHAGNQVDTGYIDWNGVRRANEFDYQCAICAGEWTIRVFIYTGYERYPGPHSAVIYIPQTTGANEGQLGGDSEISANSVNDEIPF